MAQALPAYVPWIIFLPAIAGVIQQFFGKRLPRKGEILTRLCYPKRLIGEVEELVRRHMAFVQIKQWRRAKVRRFVTGELAEEHLECDPDWIEAERAALEAELPLRVVLRVGMPRPVFEVSPQKLSEICAAHRSHQRDHLVARGVGHARVVIEDR